ncbi:MAG: carboxypeptidase-like regulatory domain-containing protein, partial [Gemmatimonas sp.]
MDSLVGKITDPKGQPVSAALVLITQRSTGQQHQAQTNARGTFSVPIPNTPKGYSLVVTAIGFATARLTVQRDSTIAARQNIAANFQLVANATQLATVQVKASRRPRFVSPDDDRLNVGSSKRDVALDVLNGKLDGDLASLVGAIAGFSTVDGGFSVLGLGADQNTTTIGGVSVDVSALPRDVLANASVTSSSSNGASGGYSGAQVALSLFTVAESERALRFTLKPQAFASSGNSSSLSTKQQSEFQLGGRVLGPWLGDRGSYGASFQFAHVGAGSQGLDAGHIPALQDLGLSSDSVNLLLSRASTLGIVNGSPARTRADDQGSVTLGLNLRFNPDRSATARLVGSASRVSNDYLSPLTVGSAGANSNRYSFTLVNTLTQYIKSVVRTSYTLGLQTSRNEVSSLLNIPTARVTLANLDAGATGNEISLTTVSLGGNPNASRPGRSQSADLIARAGWMTINSRHEIELSGGSRLESFHSDPSRNLLGTYTFATLNDFVNNQPSSFVRTVNASPRDASVSYSWLSVNDSWRVRPSFTTLYSARYDFARVLTDLPLNEMVSQKFGVRSSNTPQLNRISPRVGFSWDIDQATVKAVRGAPTPEYRRRGVLSGGYGLAVNALRASAVNPVLGASGTDAFNRELRCEGEGVPIPQWAQYASGNLDVPSSCGSLVTSAPLAGTHTRVSAFSNEFEPARNWKGNLAWRSQLSRKNTVAAEYTHLIGYGGTSRVDANLQPTPRYFATADGNRAVFVRPTEVVSANGLVPLLASRIDTAYSTVSELRSDLQSRANQLRFSFRRNIGATTSD